MLDDRADLLQEIKEVARAVKDIGSSMDLDAYNKIIENQRVEILSLKARLEEVSHSRDKYKKRCMQYKKKLNTCSKSSNCIQETMHKMQRDKRLLQSASRESILIREKISILRKLRHYANSVGHELNKMFHKVCLFINQVPALHELLCRCVASAKSLFGKFQNLDEKYTKYRRIYGEKNIRDHKKTHSLLQNALLRVDFLESLLIEYKLQIKKYRSGN